MSGSSSGDPHNSSNDLVPVMSSWPYFIAAFNLTTYKIHLHYFKQAVIFILIKRINKNISIKCKKVTTLLISFRINRNIRRNNSFKNQCCIIFKWKN